MVKLEQGESQMAVDPSKYMKDSPEVAEIFEKAVNELISANYLVAERRITALLQTIASERKLYALMQYCTEGFDFKFEFSQSRMSVQSGFRLPESRRDSVALIFGLLLKIDTNGISLSDFLNMFYYRHEGPYEEYAAFANNLLIPFRDLGLAVLNGEPEYSEETEPTEEEFEEEEPEEITIDLDDILADIDSVKELIAGESSLKEEDIEELTFVFDTLYEAVAAQDEKMIKAAFISCKNAVKTYGLFGTVTPLLGQIYDKLTVWGVL